MAPVLPRHHPQASVEGADAFQTSWSLPAHADALLNASLASLPSHGAHGRAVSLLYVTGPQELPTSQPHSV